MGKTNGFIKYQRQDPVSEPVKSRIKHFNEFSRTGNRTTIARQGARCMDCGIPFCHSSAGCPVSNLIPEWNDLVYKNLWREAYQRLEETNNFPEFTGRLCPAPCETACTLSINDNPVSIKQIELAIIENAFKRKWVQPLPPAWETGKRIAVIGSGPAGLAAAQQLRRAGHDVTVYEKSKRIGGLLRYGIPDFKLEKWIIDRRLRQMQEEGVKFETDINIGTDISARYLQKSFNVILLATGAGKARDLDIPGRDLNGVLQAMDYLTQANHSINGDIEPGQFEDARGRHVLVLGGGDTGADCVGTAIRQGAASVKQYEILPKPADWQHSWNPSWPSWPAVLRSSSSHAEGCQRDWAILTKSFVGKKGRLSAVNCIRVEWSGGIGPGGMKMTEILGSDFKAKADMVILAVGFVHAEHDRLLEKIGVEYDQRGNIQTDKFYQTNIPAVFSAGDAHVGASLVVTAINEGRRAAAAVHEYLS